MDGSLFMNQSFYDITLNANESDWRQFTVRQEDAAFKRFQNKIFSRDQYTCQFCGFRSQSFNDVVNLDGNYSNNKISNLVTACPFCSQCFFLESVGKSQGTGGVLIYLPEMTQAALNAMVHTLFFSLLMGSSFKLEAKNIYRSMRLRSQIIEKELGSGYSNPALYGQMLIDANLQVPEERGNEINEALRLLPNLKSFISYNAVWAKESIDSLK